MPITPSFSLYNAVHNFHAATDRRQWQRQTWSAHAAQREARRDASRRLGDASDETGVQDAAVALHDTMFRTARTDFCFAQGLLGFNQLPASHPRTGSAAQLQAHAPHADGRAARVLAVVRASTLGMLVGCVGKAIVLSAALVSFAPLAVLRRSLDALLHYARAGVPVPPPTGVQVAQAERRLAMQRVLNEALDRAQSPIEAPQAGQWAAALQPLPMSERMRRLHTLEQHPQLAFEGDTPSAIAVRGPLPCVPALEALLDPAVLGRSVQQDVVALWVDDRPLDVPVTWLTSPQGPRWIVQLQPTGDSDELSSALRAICRMTVPAGNYANVTPREGRTQALHLRVPMHVEIDMTLSFFGRSPRTHVALRDVTVIHESDRPLWFPSCASEPATRARADHVSPARPTQSLTPQAPTPVDRSRSPSPTQSRPGSEKSPAVITAPRRNA